MGWGWDFPEEGQLGITMQRWGHALGRGQRERHVAGCVGGGKQRCGENGHKGGHKEAR